MSSQLSNSVAKHIKDFLAKKERYDAEAQKGPFGYVEEFARLRQKSLEYRELEAYSCTEGENQYNLRKNRYKDIVPYERTRVKLSKINNINGTDYINANYVAGPVNSKQYIAAQGPLPQTVKDFWRMLWEQNVNIIIMACLEFEGDPPKHRCERYWPNSPDEKLEFDQISVSLEKEFPYDFPEYLVREMRVECCREVHKVYQLHYLCWKDHGVPEDVHPLLDMIEKSHHLQTDTSVPIVVHCSAGCGRTGTIIAIDYIYRMLKSGKLNSEFDMFTLIDEMRQQRPSMVQSVDQYRFVFTAVAELFKNHLHLMDMHAYENIKLKEPPGNPEPFNKDSENTCVTAEGASNERPSKPSEKASVTTEGAGSERPSKPSPISPRPQIPADTIKSMMKNKVPYKRQSCIPSVPLNKLKARFEQPTSPEKDTKRNSPQNVLTTEERCKKMPEIQEDDSYRVGTDVTKYVKKGAVPEYYSTYSYAKSESKMDDDQVENNLEYSYADRPPPKMFICQKYALGKTNDNADYATVDQEEDCPPLLPPRPANLLCKSSAEATVQQGRIADDNNEYVSIDVMSENQNSDDDSAPPVPPKSEDLLETLCEMTMEGSEVMADRKNKSSSLKGHDDITAEKNEVKFPHKLRKPIGPRKLSSHQDTC